MGIAIRDAARLSGTNRRRAEELESRHAALASRVDGEREAQDRRRRAIYDVALVPFRDAFARLKNVDLVELAEIDLPDAHVLPMIDAAAVRLRALTTLGAMAGGVTAGAGVGVGTYAGVGAFAAASTGTPIATLSGAAATNATLAWLGGGSLAAGGGGVAAGTVVLGGLVATPVLLAAAGFVSWQGRRHLRSQREVAVALTGAESSFALVEERATAVLARGREVRVVLADLQAAITRRLPAFTALVDDGVDYASLPPDARRRVATLVGLVTTAVATMAVPLTDDGGAVTDASGRAVADARRRLADLARDADPRRDPDLARDIERSRRTGRSRTEVA